VFNPIRRGRRLILVVCRHHGRGFRKDRRIA
jgi:hypothetical protein